MKIHSNSITWIEATLALKLAQSENKIAPDVYFDKLEQQPSRSKQHGLIVKLGALNKTSGPRKSRYWTNSGKHGANSGEYGHYAATHDEWGWFYAYLFTYDPDAVLVSMVGKFNGVTDFRKQTDNRYVAPGLERFAPIPNENPWIN